MSFFDELKRRKVFRVAISYVVAAWVIAQVVDLVADNFNAPDWVMQMVITLLIAGLPISLLLSWAFDLTSDGIRRTGSGEIEGSLVVSNRSVLALVTGLFLVLAIVFYIAWPRDDRSVAVLPFDDMSPNGDQAYLANGIADELRFELQHLEGLRVAGRRSSNAYAQEDSTTIGELLNVETILEGSVRKEGDNVRVTVQLTNVADGFSIWSESYNRKLDGIFEMQEEIATSIAGYLGVSLGVGGVNDFHGAGTENIEAYEAYLQARNKNWEMSGLNESFTLLERALELDPDYAAAWSELAFRTFMTTFDVSTDKVSEIVQRANDFALEGMRLDPESADSHSVLAGVRMAHLDWIGSHQSITRAIELLEDRQLMERYGGMLFRSGRTALAQDQFDAAMALEPLGGRPPPQAWHVSLAQRRFDEAQERSDWQSAINRLENNLDIAFNVPDREVLRTAIQAIQKADPTHVDSAGRNEPLSLSYAALYGPILDAFDSPERVLLILQDVYGDKSLSWPRKLHDIAMLAAFFGDDAFALKVKGEEVRANHTRLGGMWYPVMSEARALPEFKVLVAELNLVEYWRANGWADYCEPLGDDDFTCQ